MSQILTKFPQYITKIYVCSPLKHCDLYQEITNYGKQWQLTIHVAQMVSKQNIKDGHKRPMMVLYQNYEHINQPLDRSQMHTTPQ
jgi:hypothetical protein